MHLNSWHKWAHTIYDYASKYNHFLFDREGIEALADELNAKAKTLRNSQEILRPDFSFELRYLHYTSIIVSNEYGILFIPILGTYESK